ncbi:hypothetical protein [Jannaschia formosa]|nr:hypothetical protein [Jannaschia formosa]
MFLDQDEASDTALKNVGSQAFHAASGFEERARVVFFRMKL